MIRADDLPDSTVQGIMEGLKRSNFKVERCKQGWISNLLIFDFSQPPKGDEEDEEGDAKFTKLAEEADEEDRLCNK